MAVQLKKLLPMALFFVPLFAHASVINMPSNNLGLAGYWNFNEGSGSVAHDTSGGGHSGTISGSPSWVAGKIGKALQFTSTSQYVTTGYSINQTSATSFTWSVWVNLAGSGGTQVILGFRNATHWLKLTPSALEYYNGGIISNTIPTGKWTHIVIVKNGSTFTYYEDGAVIGTASNANSVGPNNLYIGSDPGFSDGTPDYSIDDVRIWSRALSSSEVAALYQTNAAAVQTPNGLGLLGYWQLNEGSGTTAHDVSGNNATESLLSGSAAWATGKFGSALSFSGSSYFGATVAWPSSGSISLWAYPTASSDWIGPAGWKTGSPSPTNYLLIDEGNTQHWRAVFEGNTSPGEVDVVANTPIKFNVWQHVVVTWSKSGSVYTVSLYVNGVLQNTGTWTGTALTNFGEFHIGNTGDYGDNQYSGRVDDVRVYNRALSASEVAGLYQEERTTLNDSSQALTAGSTLSQGLIGLWTFDGKDMTSNVKDESGQGNNGYLINYTSTTSAEVIGKLGQALSFNGSNQYVWGPNPAQPSGAVTIAAWVKLAAYVPWTSILDRYGNESLDCLSLGFDDSTGNTPMFMWDNSAPFTGNRVYANSSIPLNTWTYVAASSDGSTVTFYINGVAHGTGSVGAPCTGNITLGVNLPGGDEYLKGALDDVRLYNRALSASEIEQLYNAGH